MRIDSHQHFWSLARDDYGWLTPQLDRLYRDYGPEDLAPILDATGMDGTILVQAAPTEAETRYLLDIARATPFVAGVVGWVDMTAPDAARRLETLRREGGGLLVGIRPMIQDIPDPEWILDRRLDTAFDALEGLGLTFDALVKPIHLEPLLTRLARHPRLAVVVDHAAKPDIAAGTMEDWRRGLAKVASETPAYCKLSGLVTEAGPGWTRTMLMPYMEEIFALFGPARVMWGSDWPVINLCTDYLDWFEVAAEATARLAPTEGEAIFGGNAARFYGLAE